MPEIRTLGTLRTLAALAFTALFAVGASIVGLLVKPRREPIPVPVRNRRRSVRVPVAAVTAPRHSLIVREGETTTPRDVAELEAAWESINTRALRSRYDSRSYGEA